MVWHETMWTLCFASWQVWDAGGQAYIRYEASDLGEEHIGHVVENNRVVAALVAQLQVRPPPLYGPAAAGC